MACLIQLTHTVPEYGTKTVEITQIRLQKFQTLFPEYTLLKIHCIACYHGHESC